MNLTSLGKISEYKPDAILGLTKMVTDDPRENVINATVGFLRNDASQVFVPKAMLQAWQEVQMRPVTYLSPKNEFEWLGDETFIQGSLDLLFDQPDYAKLPTIGTHGGTSAVYIFLTTYAQIAKQKQILISDPTWSNHLGIAKHLGYQIHTYPHLQDNRYNFEAHAEAIKKMPPGSVILFHAGGTHNPTGTNPSQEQLEQLAALMTDKVALFDAAYLGLDTSFETDCFGFRYFLKHGISTSIAVSFSKNAGLYNQRTGVLVIPQIEAQSSLQLQRMMNSVARIVYSNPAAQGERLLAWMFANREWIQDWQSELEILREQLAARRTILAQLIPEFGFVKKQKGLFSMLPLSLDQVHTLRTDFGVYLADNGRINLGGVTASQIPLLAEALKQVLSSS